MLKNLKLRGRILLASAIPLLLFLGVTVVVFVEAGNVGQGNEIVEATHDMVNQAIRADLGASQIERATRGYLLTKDESFVRILEEGEKNFSVAIDALKKEVKDPQQKENLDKLMEIQGKVITDAKKLISLVSEGKGTQAVEFFRTGMTTRIYNEFEAIIGKFEQRENELLQARATQESASLQRLVTIVWVGALLATIAAVVIGLWVASRLSRELSDSIVSMTTSSTEIAATVAQHERTVAQQASAVNETTATVEELGASSRQSAQQAEAAAASAKQAVTVTEEGVKLANRAYGGMTGMKGKVGAVAEQILRLSEQAGQIGSIATVVSELASETNMLALNAAVEAARAGEHGKGFAVVAAEVRKLADQSKKSAERANALVADIQKATNSAVMVTEEGSKTVEEVADIAQQAGTAFTSLTAIANSVYENAQQVMLNGKQQAAALTQVTEAMKSLGAGAKEIAAGTAQTKVGMQKLNEVAQAIKVMV